MIDKLYVLDGRSSDPYRNLAIEETLLQTVSAGECILYLWQNEKTVVIGKNQNPIAECNLKKMHEDGIHLARRLSGGGAVFHDLGNLNFTFIVRNDDYDKSFQTDTVLRAVRLAGIKAEKNGRNDLVFNGRKFSGHAFYNSKDASLHHGTLMLSVDTELMSEYLTVSSEKLRGRGVSSVRSRVINLCTVEPSLNAEKIKASFIKAFSELYGRPVTRLFEEDLDTVLLAEAQARFSSNEWIYRDARFLPYSVEKRFADGTMRIDYDTRRDERGVLVFGDALISTDSLFTELDAAISLCLQGQPVSLTDSLRVMISQKADSPQTAAQIEELIQIISEGDQR